MAVFLLIIPLLCFRNKRYICMEDVRIQTYTFKNGWIGLEKVNI